MFELVLVGTLPENVEMPVVEASGGLYFAPHLYQTVETFLVIKPSHGYHSAAMTSGLCGKLSGGIGNDGDARHIAPVAAILFGEHDKSIKAAHKALVGSRTPSVEPPDETAAAVLQPEKLAEVQLEHLFATIGQVGNE